MPTQKGYWRKKAVKLSSSCLPLNEKYENTNLTLKKRIEGLILEKKARHLKNGTQRCTFRLSEFSTLRISNILPRRLLPTF